MSSQDLLAQAKTCGATTYTNRHFPDCTSIAFSPTAWDRFSSVMDQRKEKIERLRGEHGVLLGLLCLSYDLISNICGESQEESESITYLLEAIRQAQLGAMK